MRVHTNTHIYIHTHSIESLINSHSDILLLLVLLCFGVLLSYVKDQATE